MRLNNGDVVGRRCGMFDYTAKRLISVTEYEAKVKEEINRIKANTSINSNSPWISNRRLGKGKDPRLWEEDNVIRIPKVGNALAKKLKDNGITIVKQLKFLPAEELKQLVNSGLPKPSLLLAVDKCADAEVGTYPCRMVDHHQHDNPYQSRFPDDYESRLRTCSALKPFICVTELLK